MDIIATLRPVNEKKFTANRLIKVIVLSRDIRHSGAGTKAIFFFFSLVINVLSVRLKVNMNPDQFRLLSVCLCPSLCPQASLSNQPAICFKGSQGVRCFAYSP